MATPLTAMTEQVDDYLRHIFHAEYTNAWVTGFTHDPAASTADGRVQALAWGGAPYATARNRIRPDSNNYLCISTFRPGEDGRVRRRTALHAATYALMIDDVDEKVPRERIPLPPTLTIQTSPGSQQWWYVMERPITDGAAVRAVIDNLINAGLMTDNKDPGMRGVNRYGRLPFGLNTKAKYRARDGSYPVVHMASAPQWKRRYTLEQFCEAFGISNRAPAVEHARRPVPADAERFNIEMYSALVAEDLIKEDRGGGKYDITCPWVAEHTNKADTGTAYFEAGHVDLVTGEVYPLGGFKCHHGHGDVYHLTDVVRYLVKLGYTAINLPVPEARDAAEEFADAEPLPLTIEEMLWLPADIDPEALAATPADAQPNIRWSEYEPTDLANAMRLHAASAGRLRWHVEAGIWMSFNGSLWLADPNRTTLNELIAQVGLGIFDIAAQARAGGNDTVAKAMEKWGYASRQSGRIEAAESLFKTLRGVPVNASEVDTDPTVLCCTNGIVDLTTGTMLPPDRRRMVILNTGLPYEPDADPTAFDTFLREVLGHPDGTPDPALYEYVRLFLGYCTTGLRTIELFTILHGSGTNGKSTLLAVLEHVLGGYARRVRPELFEVSRNKTSSSAATPELAVLPGARVVLASESSENTRLNMELVKQMTGDTMSARHLHRQEFTFTPQFKALMSTNHLPIIVGTGHAVWRRIHPIPFDRQWRLPGDTPDANPPADLGLRARLLGPAAPGTLRWLVEAARDFLALGALPPPPRRVSMAQGEYRSNSDMLGRFIDEQCEVGQGFQGVGLYKQYRLWAMDNGLHPISNVTFGRQMLERGFDKPRIRTDGSGVRYYHGIKLKDLEGG